jgi:hypothetical protein
MFPRKSAAPQVKEAIAHQPPGEIFPWPKGTILTAVDDVVLALPVALFGPDEPIGSVLFCPDDMELNVPPGSDRFYIHLRPGMSVHLAKSCQACVVAEDKQPRRIKASAPLVKE